MGLIRFLKKKRRQLFKDTRIAYLELDGIIAEHKSVSSAPHFLEQLEEVEKQEFKALVLRINSPGGTVGLSQEIYDKLVHLRKKQNLIVVASLGDVAASGGVYVAMAADEIVAHGGTVTGSIGVIIKSGNIRELLDKIGIHSDVVKSGRFKDILSNDRPMTDEERALIQETIDDTYAQFVEVVAVGRGLSIEAVKEFADGRIFSGQQALKYGLINAVGGKDAAVERARKLAGFPMEGPPQIIMLEKKKPLLRRLLEAEMRHGSGAVFQKLDHALAFQQRLSGVPLWLMPGDFI